MTRAEILSLPSLALLALAIGSVVHAAPAPAASFKSGVFEPPRDAPDFELDGSDGAPLKLSRFRGKVVALAFGFTYCQRVCPVTLANLARVSTELGADARDLQVVFVTVDPVRDTPARLKQYLAFFNPSFVGGSGTPARLEAVRKLYGITTKREQSENKRLGYEIHHSSSIFLIDRAGKQRLLVPFGKPAADILHDVELLLKQ